MNRKRRTKNSWSWMELRSVEKNVEKKSVEKLKTKQNPVFKPVSEHCRNKDNLHVRNI